MTSLWSHSMKMAEKGYKPRNRVQLWKLSLSSVCERMESETVTFSIGLINCWISGSRCLGNKIQYDINHVAEIDLGPNPETAFIIFLTFGELFNVSRLHFPQRLSGGNNTS